MSELPPCAITGCPNPARTMSLCSTHYGKRLTSGRTGLVDAAPVIGHIERLVALDWDVRAISEASGVDDGNLYRMLQDRRSRCQMSTAKRILAVQPIPMGSIGSVRRVQALMRIGWLKREIAEAAGFTTNAISALLYRGECRFALSAAIRRVYSECAYKTPPAPTPAIARTRKVVIARAKNQGWVAAAAWENIDTDLEPQGVLVCRFDGCLGVATRRGWCESHYRRWLRSGSPDLVGKIGRPRGDSPTYNAIHFRLARQYGKAKTHSCVSCGKTAATWSYDHTDLDEQLDDLGRPYSTDLDRYQPRCVPCHHRLDKATKSSKYEGLVDEVAVERVLHDLRHGGGDASCLNPSEKRLAAAKLLKQGAGLNKTSKQLGLGWATIRKIAEEVAA